MHYSRIMPVVNGARYFASTAVFLNEIIKFFICSAMFIREKERERQPLSLIGVWVEIFAVDAWKLSIPAALYTVLPITSVGGLIRVASEQSSIYCGIKS